MPPLEWWWRGIIAAGDEQGQVAGREVLLPMRGIGCVYVEWN